MTQTGLKKLEKKVNLLSKALHLLLFEEYRKSIKDVVTDRSYRNYVKRMVELGLIKVEGSGRWKVYETST